MPAWLTSLRLRVRAFVSRSHDRELRDELQLHLDLLADEYQAQGLSPDDARRRAHREFGNATRVQETSHDLFAFRTLETIVKDLAYATREMRRSPGFTAVAVLSLAVGIGAVTTAFAVLDAFLLRPLAVPAPERLVALSTGTASDWSRWSYGQFRAWADAPDAAFAAAAIYKLNPLEQPRLGGVDGQAVVNVRVSLVSGNYFDVLRVPIASGRALSAEDDRVPGAHRVAVISDAFRQRHFGGETAIGRTVALNGSPYEIVGVARRAFTGEWVGEPVDAWLPLAMRASVVRGSEPANEQSPARWLRVVARLSDEVSIEQAAASATLLQQRYLASQPANVESRDRGEAIELLSAARGYAPSRARYTQPLLILTAIVALVLVVACANFTNLLLARAESRRREFAVRLALGASRWRIARQSLTECVLLAGLAGVFGLVVSGWATTTAVTQFGAAVQPIELQLFSTRLVLFDAACVALVIVFGGVPALRAAWRSAPLGMATLASPRRRELAGRALLVGQLALCAVLLIGTGLLLRTVGNLRAQWLGFERNVLLVTLALDRAGYTGETGRLLIDRVRERLLAIRGIEHVSVTRAGLLDPSAYWIEGGDSIAPAGQPPVPGVRWTMTDVGAGFFATVGMPIVRGRAFEDGDFASSGPAIVINQALATALFGSVDPIGRQITTGTSTRLVVGMVNDARQISPRDHGTGVIYRPLRDTPRQVVLAVQTRESPVAALDVVQHQLAAMDDGVPIVDVRTVDELLDEAIAQERLMSRLGLWLGALTVLVTCVGLYALISYEVTRRKHEIGVRLALGATRGAVAGLMLRECGGLVALGLALGVPLSLGATRPLASRLFGLQANDPQTIGAVVALLVVVALLAAARPARAAARIDPVALLRAD